MSTATVDGTSAERAPGLLLGAVVSVRLFSGEVMKGEVFCFEDQNTNIVVLRDVVGKDRAHFHLIKTHHISEVVALNPPPEKLETALPTCTKSQLEEREQMALLEFQKKKHTIGIHVTQDAQEIFDFIHKTHPDCCWLEGSRIQVMGITVSPPYDPQSCEGKGRALERIQQVLERFNERKKKQRSDTGAGRLPVSNQVSAAYSHVHHSPGYPLAYAGPNPSGASPVLVSAAGAPTPGGIPQLIPPGSVAYGVPHLEGTHSCTAVFPGCIPTSGTAGLDGSQQQQEQSTGAVAPPGGPAVFLSAAGSSAPTGQLGTGRDGTGMVLVQPAGVPAPRGGMFFMLVQGGKDGTGLVPTNPGMMSGAIPGPAVITAQPGVGVPNASQHGIPPAPTLCPSSEGSRPGGVRPPFYAPIVFASHVGCSPAPTSQYALELGQQQDEGANVAGGVPVVDSQVGTTGDIPLASGVTAVEESQQHDLGSYNTAQAGNGGGYLGVDPQQCSAATSSTTYGKGEGSGDANGAAKSGAEKFTVGAAAPASFMEASRQGAGPNGGNGASSLTSCVPGHSANGKGNESGAKRVRGSSSGGQYGLTVGSSMEGSSSTPASSGPPSSGATPSGLNSHGGFSSQPITNSTATPTPLLHQLSSGTSGPSRSGFERSVSNASFKDTLPVSRAAPPPPPPPPPPTSLPQSGRGSGTSGGHQRWGPARSGSGCSVSSTPGGRAGGGGGGGPPSQHQHQQHSGHHYGSGSNQHGGGGGHANPGQGGGGYQGSRSGGGGANRGSMSQVGQHENRKKETDQKRFNRIGRIGEMGGSTKPCRIGRFPHFGHACRETAVEVDVVNNELIE